MRPEDLLTAGDEDVEQDRKDLYSLHSLVALAEEDTMSDVFTDPARDREKERLKMRKHIEYLHHKAEKYVGTLFLPTLHAISSISF